LVILAALSLGAGGVPAAWGGQAVLIPLQCRLGQGPWQDCQMRVEQLGAHWFLLIGGRRIEFRHDGQGAVTMQEQGRTREVTSRWGEDQTLCWDGTCARGEIPLD
jgi:hypothetical protein